MSKNVREAVDKKLSSGCDAPPASRVPALRVHSRDATLPTTIRPSHGQVRRSRAAVAKFRIASTPRFLDRQTNEWKDGEPLFLQCNIWRQAAENVAESLQRGARVIVTGRLRQRTYETREGEKRTVMELEVDEVGPSLRYATAKVQKMSRSSGGGGGGGFGSGGGNNGGGFDDPWASAVPAGGGSGNSFDEEPPF